MTDTIDPDTLSKDERSFLLYAESCCVDGGGLLVGIRMNDADHDAAKRFIAEGLLQFGRIPAALLGVRPSMDSAKLPPRPEGSTHWCQLTNAGWALAHQLRRLRAQRRGPFATMVFEHEITVDKLRGQGA